MWWDRKTYSPDGNDEGDQIPTRRIWHSHEKWEDAANGMWGQIEGKYRSMVLANAVDFTGDHDLYGEYMLKVLDLWPVSCEHNLSARGMNRKAWIGHAACCLAIGCPEDITRDAWGHLTKKQQRMANRQAEIAIKHWEVNYAENSLRDGRFNGCEGKDFSCFRPVQQNLFEFFRRQGQHCNVAPCNR
jgi:hypothetical protein